MFPRVYTLVPLALIAYGLDIPWSDDDCEVHIGYNLPQPAYSSPELSYPYSSWLLATCNGTESLLDLNQCLGLIDGQLIPQNKGRCWDHHLSQRPCRSCCSYDISDDWTAFTAQCKDHDVTSLLLNQTITITNDGVVKCLDYVGQVINTPDMTSYAHHELRRSMVPNATATSTAQSGATASVCPSTTTRAFPPPGSNSSACGNATSNMSALNAGVSLVSTSIDALVAGLVVALSVL
ncbi:hypothetical protein F4779DRAFT_638484 [Xylariaceae sp. FL0662B]|nr:hypothetical protein F4779DRAFT_638484 [Xylariaceae sp. FL0662B]